MASHLSRLGLLPSVEYTFTPPAYATDAPRSQARLYEAHRVGSYDALCRPDPLSALSGDRSATSRRSAGRPPRLQSLSAKRFRFANWRICMIQWLGSSSRKVAAG